jgi:hypothetical protein
MPTDVSEEHVASIFRREEENNQETSIKQAVSTAKTSLNFNRNTRYYIPEDITLHKFLPFKA